MFEISTDILDLPKDVEMPFALEVHGEYTGADDEVIVIRQIQREILPKANVCHVSRGSEGTGIYDMPGFKYIRLGRNPLHMRDGFRFTMACIAESEANKTLPAWQRGIGLANWLY